MSDITYTRITPDGEEKCSLLNGDGMTENKRYECNKCLKVGICRRAEKHTIGCRQFIECPPMPPINFVKANPDDEVKQADDAINSGLADSGTRREFASGAVRDVAEGKGDMVSFPNAAILRLSKHYEAGAKKYGRWNYTKGIPVSSFMDSALRHIFKYLDGWDDEDHLAAAAFNILGAMQMEAKHPELIDVPNREGKNRFEYKEDTK